MSDGNQGLLPLAAGTGKSNKQRKISFRGSLQKKKPPNKSTATQKQAPPSPHVVVTQQDEADDDGSPAKATTPQDSLVNRDESPTHAAAVTATVPTAVATRGGETKDMDVNSAVSDKDTPATTTTITHDDNNTDISTSKQQQTPPKKKTGRKITIGGGITTKKNDTKITASEVNDNLSHGKSVLDAEKTVDETLEPPRKETRPMRTARDKVPASKKNVTDAANDDDNEENVETAAKIMQPSRKRTPRKAAAKKDDNSDQDDAADEEPKKKKRKLPAGTKRGKKSSAAVPDNSQPQDPPQQHEDDDAETETALVPAAAVTAAVHKHDDTTLSGQPRLKAFCTTFKSKPRKSAAAAPAIPAAAAPAAYDEEKDMEPSGPVVSIVNGEIVLQESSMVVAGNKTGNQTLEDEDAEVVEEEAQLGGISSTYASYRKTKAAGGHWPAADTRKFYQALRQVGQDFGTMEAYFDGKRTRRALKNKFRQESNKNPKLVEAALHPKKRQKIDMAVFEVNEDEIDKEALLKSRQERDEAFVKTQQAHEARQKREEEEAKKPPVEEEELVDETPVAIQPALYVPPVTKKSFFDDTNMFWEEAPQESAEEELLGPSIMTDDALTPSTMSKEHATGGISLVSASNKNKKKKKPSFRSPRSKKKAK